MDELRLESVGSWVVRVVASGGMAPRRSGMCSDPAIRRTLATGVLLGVLVVTMTTPALAARDTARYREDPTRTRPALITAGPDGNLWFTEPDASNIGRITTAGAITTFPTPTSSSYPL